jgi:hypothetical protein
MNSSLSEDHSNLIGVGTNLSKYLSLVADARDAFGAQQCSSERNDSLLLAEIGAAHCYPQPSSKFNQSRLNHNPSDNATLTISLYQTYYGNAARDVNDAWKSCRRPCLEIGVANDVDAAASADVVNIVMQGSHSIPWKRPAHQIWVGVYFESPGHTPFQDKEDFNLTLGFRADSDFPIFGMAFDTFQHYEGLLPNALRVKDFTLPTFEAKNASDMAMMSVWISNCGMETSGRIRILNELASHGVTYASYGGCQHTHSPQEARSTLLTEWRGLPADGGAEKIAVSTKHLFLYAAENSVYPWYITEKVFHGLAAGSVPVYIGDSVHLKHMAPPNSIIYADDFESVEALATHVKYVARDPALYEKYLEWRHQPGGVDNVNRVLALELWKNEHGSEYACALCEFLHLVAGK